MLTTSPSFASLCDVNLCDINLCDVKLCDVSVCVCVVSSCMMSSCVMSTCVMSICVMSICVMSSCVMSTCVMSTCVMSSCVTSIFVMSICVVSICVMSSCVMSICVISICVMSSCVMSICVMWSCVMSICVISICVMSTCVMSICVMWSCVTSIFVMSICALSSYVMSVCACVMSICVVSICVMSSCVMSICVISICVMSTCVMSTCVMWSCVTSIFVMSICAMSSYVMSVCVCVCDVKLCDVNLCDFNLCDVNLCDVNLCDVKLCDVNLCDVNLCDVKLCDASVRVCDVNLCGVNLCDVKLCDVKLCDFNLCDVNLCDVNLCDVNLCNANLCAQLPQTQFTHSKAPNPHASKTSTQNFRTSYWHSYPKSNLDTARRQTRMPARHPHKIFAPPISTATPNAIYTQQAAKPACQEDIDAKFSQLLLAQLPRTQFTHSAPPNPHASRISTQNFRSSYWHSYPERNSHTASRQTRMQGRHRRKVFAPPIGTATPNAIYTQHGPKPACQQHIHTKFSQLLLAQLPRTQFTHSTAPNPHASNTSTQHFRSSYWPATPNNIYTQHGPKPACQQHIHTKFSQLLMAQLPRTQFTHSKAPNPHASNTSTQNFRSSYWHSYPEQHLHTARPQTRMPATHPHKIFAAPIGTATPNNIYTQHGPKPECQQPIHTNFRSSYWHSYPKHNLHTAKLQTRMPATHPHKIFAAPIESPSQVALRQCTGILATGVQIEFIVQTPKITKIKFRANPKFQAKTCADPCIRIFPKKTSETVPWIKSLTPRFFFKKITKKC